jgi:hypothetical protein
LIRRQATYATRNIQTTVWNDSVTNGHFETFHLQGVFVRLFWIPASLISISRARKALMAGSIYREPKRVFSSCHNPLPLREAAEAEVGCAALHCKALSTPEAAALLSLNRVDHHRKLGSASGATIGFSDADKKLSKLSPTCVAPAVGVNSA